MYNVVVVHSICEQGEVTKMEKNQTGPCAGCETLDPTLLRRLRIVVSLARIPGCICCVYLAVGFGPMYPYYAN